MAQDEIRIGDVIGTEWWPESVEAESGTDILNISNTSFAVGSPEVGVSFVAPRSGRALVCISAAMTEQSAGDRIFVSFAVHEGTSTAGTTVRSVRTMFGVATHGDTTAGGTDEMNKGNATMIEGLVGGDTYYAVVMHATDGGTTNDIGHRRITVVPLP